MSKLTFIRGIMIGDNMKIVKQELLAESLLVGVTSGFIFGF